MQKYTHPHSPEASADARQQRLRIIDKAVTYVTNTPLPEQPDISANTSPETAKVGSLSVQGIQGINAQDMFLTPWQRNARLNAEAIRTEIMAAHDEQAQNPPYPGDNL